MSTPPGPVAAEPFVHEIRARYGDCDMQGIVFNAHYLAFVDDTIDSWLRHAMGADYLQRFEYLVKKATLEWHSPTVAHELVRLTPTVSRWGRTSLTVRVAMQVGERAVADAELVLVSATPGTHTPVVVPADVRAQLGGH